MRAISASGLSTLSANVAAKPAASAPTANACRRPRSTVTANHADTTASQRITPVAYTRSSVRPEVLHVQPHPLQRRRDHDAEQREQNRREPAEHPPATPGEGPVGEQQDRQRQRRHGDELEEAVPRVLRVGEVRLSDDERAASEQVTELDDDEGEEEHVEDCEGDTDLERSETAPGLRARDLLADPRAGR